LTRPTHASPLTSSQTSDRTTTPGGQSAAIAAARDLLARTAELPSSNRELLAVLGEYRRAVLALTAVECDPVAAAQ